MPHTYQKTEPHSLVPTRYDQFDLDIADDTPDYMTLSKTQRAIQLVVGFITGLLAVRFLLALFGATTRSSFGTFVQDLSHPFAVPFQGVLNRAPVAEGMRFDTAALLGVVMYLVLGLLLVKVIDVFRSNEFKTVNK